MDIFVDFDEGLGRMAMVVVAAASSSSTVVPL